MVLPTLSMTSLLQLKKSSLSFFLKARMSPLDVTFIGEVLARGPDREFDEAFTCIWKRRIPKRDAMGIHGILFYELDHKKQYYPTRKDEEAINPDGTRLR